MRIVVIGGTGQIGARLVARLRSFGHDMVSASRSCGVDVMTGTSLWAAVEGADAVVDVSNPPPDVKPLDYFATAVRRITSTVHQTGVGHLVVLSVVGVNELTSSDYFRAKLLQEEAIRSSGLPFTILRSTQFFEFMPTIADANTLDGVVRVPDLLVRPVAADDVADALAAIAPGPATLACKSLAGPEEATLANVITRILGVRSDPRGVRVEPNATYFGLRLLHRALLPRGSFNSGGTTLCDWLRRSTDTRAAPETTAL